MAFSNWMDESGYTKRISDWLLQQAKKHKKKSNLWFFQARAHIVDLFKALFVEHRGYEAQAVVGYKAMGVPPNPSNYGRGAEPAEEK